MWRTGLRAIGRLGGESGFFRAFGGVLWCVFCFAFWWTIYGGEGWVCVFFFGWGGFLNGRFSIFFLVLWCFWWALVEEAQAELGADQQRLRAAEGGGVQTPGGWCRGAGWFLSFFFFFKGVSWLVSLSFLKLWKSWIEISPGIGVLKWTPVVWTFFCYQKAEEFAWKFVSLCRAGGGEWTSTKDVRLGG